MPYLLHHLILTKPIDFFYPQPHPLFSFLEIKPPDSNKQNGSSFFLFFFSITILIFNVNTQERRRRTAMETKIHLVTSKYKRDTRIIRQSNIIKFALKGTKGTGLSTEQQQEKKPKYIKSLEAACAQRRTIRQAREK